MRLAVFCLLLIAHQAVFAQCDQLFADPEFGVVNKWKPKDRLFAIEVNFEAACLARSQCYLDGSSRRSRCDTQYRKDLTEVCESGYQFEERLFGQCMQTINAAAKLVELEGAQYYRLQKRKADTLKREADRKARAKKRKVKSAQRAEERRKKRMGR